MLVGSIAVFASNMQSSRLHAQMVLEVNDQGTSIARAIIQAIRSADSINAPLSGTSASSLSLSNTNAALNPIAFTQTGEVLYIVEGAGSPVALSNNKVRVSNLTFNNLSRTATPGVVQFRFTLQNTASTTRAEEQYAVDFYGTASIRK